jgi:thymidylate synthase
LERVEEEPFSFPTVTIKENRENINYQVEDVVINTYYNYEAIVVAMVA